MNDTKNGGCTHINNIFPNEPQRMPFKGLGGNEVCQCNRMAYQMDPNVCTVLCPQTLLDDDCACIDYNYAGLFCDERVCKMGGIVYCTGGFMGGVTKRKCDGKHVNRGKMENIRHCECKRGKLVASYCQCESNYTGTFCEEYNSPSISGSGGNGTNGGYRRRAKPSILGDWEFHPLVIVGTIVLGIILASFFAWKAYKRRRGNHARGVTAQTPIPASSMPMQPVQTTYQSAISCTYTFQPPEQQGYQQPATSIPEQQPILPTAPPQTEDYEQPPIQQVNPPPPSYDEATKT